MRMPVILKTDSYDELDLPQKISSKPNHKISIPKIKPRHPSVSYVIHCFIDRTPLFIFNDFGLNYAMFRVGNLRS